MPCFEESCTKRVTRSETNARYFKRTKRAYNQLKQIQVQPTIRIRLQLTPGPSSSYSLSIKSHLLSTGTVPMSFKRCSSSPSPESTSPYDAPIFKKPRLEATEITPALYYILESLESDVNGLSYEKMVLYVTALHEAYQEQAVELASAQRELKHASEVQANLREMSDVMESKLEKQSIELASTRKDLEVQKKLQVLRDELATFRTELENVGAVKTSKVQGPTTSAGEIRAKVHEMADTMGSEIRKQMKWQ